MSNDPLGRYITKSLDPYWEKHPNQRDFWHGLYHCIMGGLYAEAGEYERSHKDVERCLDHWVRHENQKQYKERTGRSRSKSN